VDATKTGLLRPTTGEASHRVTYIELFFDLVFVFAVTQLSHILIHQQTGIALLHTVMLTMVVWFAWVYTTWAMSWLDPERGPVGTLLFVMMALGLLIAATIPEAFGGLALPFALSLVAFSLARSVFAIVAFGRAQRTEHAMNFVRISCWHVGTGILWIVGALVTEDARLWVWLAAVVLEYIGPRIRFWVPGVGASSVHSWNVSGEHMAERVSLFVIIVLGESIVVTGSTFAEVGITWLNGTAFLAAFVGAVLMFLLYFRHNQRHGSDFISRASDRGMIAQTAFTYIPLLLVFGVVASAVADGLILRDPAGAGSTWLAGLLCGGAALYVLGNALFGRSTGGPWLRVHLIGAVVLLALIAVSSIVNPLVLSWIVNAVLLAVVLSETRGRLRT